ncbi:MAG: hypothetical protein ACOCP4_05610 [Candidatus Woesearchaeota archaeon]
MKVYTNRQLFEKIQILGEQIKDLGAIIKNDQNIDENDIAEFCAEYNRLLAELDGWLYDTIAYIKE